MFITRGALINARNYLATLHLKEGCNKLRFSTSMTRLDILIDNHEIGAIVLLKSVILPHNCTTEDFIASLKKHVNIPEDGF
jgi:hypothetical protein